MQEKYYLEIKRMKDNLQKYTDLVSEKIGGEVLYCTDDFLPKKKI